MDARLTLLSLTPFVEHIAEFVNHVGIQNGGGTMISNEYFPPEKILSIPRDATAFYQRGTWIDCHAMIGSGQRAELDKWVTEWAQRLVDHIVKLEKEDQDIPDSIKPGGLHGYWYTADGMDKKQVFGTNYERLAVLKKKYDPDMVFHSWFPISPEE